MSRSVALIACSNGYGHVRRCIAISKALLDKNMDVSLFAPASSVSSILQSYETGLDAEIIDFKTDTNINAFREGDSHIFDWYKKLPSLNRFDVVVSDNLPETLLHHENVILSGNFMWHQILDDVSEKYREFVSNLIKKFKPTMLTYGPFRYEYDEYDINYQNVGLPRLFKTEKINKNNILISVGKSGVEIDAYRELLNHIISQPKPDVDILYIEPALYQNSFPDWIRPADYSSTMYNSLVAAICRPGMGSITDCLLSGTYLYPLYEIENEEMKFNAKQIENLGVGVDINKPLAIWNSLLEFISDVDKKNKVEETLSNISDAGAEEAAEIIKNYG